MNKNNLKGFEFFRGLVAIFIAIAVAFIFIFICADDPAQALSCLLIKPIISNGALNVKSILTILGRTTPTIFTGLAVCVMFSADQFNLGGEGVTMLGGFIAVLLGIYLPMAAGVHAAVAIIISAIAGGAVMLIPALVKVKLKSSEMVTSLMLNYIILYVVLHFLNNTFADRTKGSTQTYEFLETAKVGTVVQGTELTYGFFIALIATVIIAIFMYRTRWGYAIRMIGINGQFAQYSGLKVGTIIIASQIIGGAFLIFDSILSCSFSITGSIIYGSFGLTFCICIQLKFGSVKVCLSMSITIRRIPIIFFNADTCFLILVCHTCLICLFVIRMNFNLHIRPAAICITIPAVIFTKCNINAFRINRIKNNIFIFSCIVLGKSITVGNGFFDGI